MCKERNKPEKRMLFAFLLNLFFAVLEVIGGMLTGSITILSDSIHDFCDSAALLFAFFMEKLSKKQKNESYPFGYRRFSVLSGLVNNLILISCSVFIIQNSVHRFFTPREVNGGAMFLFAIFGILINGSAMLLTVKGKNVNVRTVSIHMLEDVLTWFAVLIVGGVMFFYEIPELDSILSIVIALVILVSSFLNMKEIIFLLAMRAPGDKKTNRKLLDSVQKVCNEFYFKTKIIVEVFPYSLDGAERKAILLLSYEGELSESEQKILFLRLQKTMEHNGIAQFSIMKKLS